MSNQTRPRTLPCALCTRMFAAPGDLNQHINAVHGGNHANETIRQQTSDPSPPQPILKTPNRWENSIQFVRESGTDTKPAPTAEKQIAKKEKQKKKQKGSGYQGHSSYRQSVPYTSWTMDMGQGNSWGLCDKDCGWCGHCMNFVDI
ncbi:hypothetical protein ASPZODRAFT_137503 [Penicilliopsis zonata CBS 506.65]|uniref:C2H2-type domain-containing protein n=1 Tax=Penicilliopsis zonata CBS 506.65 TaxID=1073090 RepID=A0A1L9S4L5_9EURO|nr:hypothetical protein ASPZODRAFT_137503 [Penicilliopsis zonata CBS 506.65]OJJ42084.1 hypothetical protein ASPZODRAFT_137503 [Penicilliopsis zonata CBS 506.65]